MNPLPPDIEAIGNDVIRRIKGERHDRHNRLINMWAAFLFGIAAGTALGIAIARAEPISGPVRIVDGDTIALPSGEIVRILNIDAPETRLCERMPPGARSCARCAADAEAGQRAKARLTELLSAAPLDIQRCDGSRCTDPYGRTLARISAGGRDVGEILITEGLASRWPKRWNGCGGAG